MRGAAVAVRAGAWAVRGAQLQSCELVDQDGDDGVFALAAVPETAGRAPRAAGGAGAGLDRDDGTGRALAAWGYAMAQADLRSGRIAGGAGVSLRHEPVGVPGRPG